MPELAQPDNFQGADRTYHFRLIDSPPAFSGLEYNLYTVTAPSFCVVRFLNVAAIGNGNVGTWTATLNGLYPFGVDTKLGYGGELISAIPFDIPAADTARITWSTDVDTAYGHDDSNSGFVAQVPIPVTYLPAGTIISVLFTPSAGGNATPYVDFAQLVVELVSPAAIGADTTGQGGNVYLLPQTI